MSEAPKAVFLSYASQDAGAAARLCEALRAAGVEVWFDQNELVGGDAWDAKIRKQIAECALFVPIVSASTQARREGYFRLEWRIAAQRTHMMSESVAFLLPVVIDATRDAEADVPGEFKAVQWTRIGSADSLAAFCERVKRLLGGAGRDAAPRRRESDGGDSSGRLGETSLPMKTARRVPAAAWIAAVAVVGGTALYFALRPDRNAGAGTRPPTSEKAAPTPADALVAKARALLEDDPLRTRRNLELAEQFSLQAIALDATNAEALAAAAWVNFLFLSENYDDTPQRRADLRRYAESAVLLAPQSVNAQLAMNGVLLATGNRPEAARQLATLAELHPNNLTVLCQLAWTAAWTSEANWETAAETGQARFDRLRAHSPLGRSHADSILAGQLWVRGKYVEADRILDGIFAAGNPVRLAYLSRLLILTYGWGDLERAKAFITTIPDKLLLEDVFICHVANVWIWLGEYDRALATLNRTQRDLLHEARIELPTDLLRGKALAAAGRPNAAVIAWRAALQVVERQLATDSRNVAALENKLELLQRLGEREAAERQFTLLTELQHPSEGSIAWALSLPYFVRKGDFDAAVPRADRLIARDHGRWANAYNELRHDPEMAKFRQDPRVQPILARAAGWLDEIRAGKAAPPAPAGPAPLAAGLPPAAAPAAASVAVLAFDNRSDDKDAEYFSDGISDELINALGRLPGLTVRGRTSAFFFKGRNATAREIGEKLGVAYLVRGSVRKAGGKVRITAQLSRAATDEVVWTSEPLERELRDVFAVQDEIVAVIAKNLSVSMGVAPRAPRQVNPEALTALLEGRHFWVLRTAEGFARARELFDRAVALDPGWAPAHAALANLLTIEASFLKGGGESVSGRFAAAAREAQRAIELDATLGEPHAALGKIAMEDRRLAEAEQEFRRALALEPNNALVRDWYGDLAVTQGRLDLAIAEYRRALELEPLSPYIQWDLAWELLHVRRYAEALALVERATALTPNGSARLALRRARLLMELGRRAEAEVALRAYLEGNRTGSDPQFANEAVWCLNVLGSAAERERWTAELLRQYPDSFASGVILLMAGQLERAYPLLEKTPAIFWQQLYWEPAFDPVRDTPRFRQLLEKLGCAAEYKVARETQARLLKEGGTAK